MIKGTILIITHSYAPNSGGVETHLTDLTEYIAEKKLPCLIITYQPLVTRAWGKTIEHIGSAKIIRIPYIGLGIFNKLEKHPALQFLYLFPILFATSFLTVLFNKRQIKAIHAHGMVCAVISRLLKSVFKIKTVVSTHAVYGWLYDLENKGILPKFLRWTLKGQDKVLALAEKSKDELIKMGLPEDKADTYTHWVNQKRFHPENKTTARSKLKIKETFTILFVGRLIKVKGVIDLMHAVSNIPDAQLIIAGSGPIEAEISLFSTKHSNIIYAGSINNKELPLYYSAADILCVPSQYEEGFGRIILEALSCGTPVMASKIGGIPEAMDETVGLFIEPTQEDIIRTIKKLIADKTLLRSITKNCRPYAEKRYSTKNAEKIIACYGPE